jgi:hypothetical protein
MLAHGSAAGGGAGGAVGCAGGLGAVVGGIAVGRGSAVGATVGGATVARGSAVGGRGVGVAAAAVGAAAVGDGTTVAGAAVRNSNETVATLTGVNVGRRVRVGVGVAAALPPAHAPNANDMSIRIVADSAANASHLRGFFRIGICINISFPGRYVDMTYHAATSGSSTELRVW